MPIKPPALDDRDYDALVGELLARIPAHTPEWTNPRQGDPGRTLLELFAWLTDTMLYRVNLIPERQRLAFLRLLGEQMRPAEPARGLVTIQIDNADFTDSITIKPLATIKKPITFETLSEVTLMPLTAEAYYKRILSTDELQQMRLVIEGLKQIYNIREAKPYQTTPIFTSGVVTKGFDVIANSSDGCLWLALLAAKPEHVEAARNALGRSPQGRPQLLNIGFAPAFTAPDPFEEIEARARIPYVWEITGLDAGGRPEYLTLQVVADTTLGLRKPGIFRLALPAPELIIAPSNNPRDNTEAGVGDTPPRLDAPDKASRLVAWLRLRPTIELKSLLISWVNINAVPIDQRQTFYGRIVGASDGTGNQKMALASRPIDPNTFQLMVEEPDRGYQLWQRVDDLSMTGRDDSVFELDSEAGAIRFGDGVRGKVPIIGARVRVAQMRGGGGVAGNLPPNSLAEVRANRLDGSVVSTKLKVVQALPTEGGLDAETLAEAERRIPALFRHRDRAVTVEDYEQLANTAPGVRLGRVEVLPRFKPQQRRENVPGVVSVMVLPYKDGYMAPYPRPDRPLLEVVHAHLAERRPLGTELYVMGVEYVPIALSVAITVVTDNRTSLSIAGVYGEPNDLSAPGPDQVINEVIAALRRFFWPLLPGGALGTGWERGRAVLDRELEVVVARVQGVDTVSSVNLFERNADRWEMVERPTRDARVQIPLNSYQLPELMAVSVVIGTEAPETVSNPIEPYTGDGIAVPVVPEKC
jgi:hypothetical protein